VTEAKVEQGFEDLVRRDVVGEAEEGEAATLRTDENVREWYETLKRMKQDAERDLAEVKSSVKRSPRSSPLYGKADELGLEICWINDALSEARERVKDLNVREAAAKAKRPLRAVPAPPPSPEPIVLTDDAQLRGDLRAAQRMMRRCFDFLRDDSNVTFRAMDKRDALLADLRREVRGL
jgi:hypothetical protein